MRLAPLRQYLPVAILGALLLSCGPVKPKTIDCNDVAACGSHGTCDDSSGTARCLCEQGYVGSTCELCDTGYERDSNNNCVIIVTCESFCAAQGRTCVAQAGGDYTCGDCLPGWFEDHGRCYQACEAVTVPGELVPLDVYIMLDRSGSMGDENKWSQMTTAINTFVGSSDAAGMGVGIQFFPVEPPQGTVIPSSCSTDADCGLYGPCIPMFGCGGSMATDTSCDPADYAVPAVPIAELPGVSAAITSAISNTSAGGSATPTQPSFEGAATYVSAWAADNPTHLVYLLYATDGMPTGCTYNSVSAAATRAAELAAGSPPVPTYVFGVECSSENIDLDNLNDIASAGGTGSAILVDSSGTVTQTFIDTLNAIRSNAQCKYRIPEPENQQADPNLVNVSLSDPDVPGSNEQLYNTISLEGCDSSGGWYYDDVNNPTMILLCPATCDRVAQEQLDVNILVGCTTIVK